MYLTHVSYVAASGQADFDVTFPYLEASHVVVTVNGVVVPFEWLTGSRIRLAYPAANGDAVVLRRETPIDRALVDFQNGAVLTEEDLNKAVRQVLYTQQEILDLYKTSLSAAQVRLGNNLGIVTDPTKIMDELAQMVLADELLADLNERLAEVNLNAQTIIEGQLRSHDLKEGVNVIRGEVKEVKNETGQLGSVLDLLVIPAPDGNSLVLREDKVFRGNGQSFASSFEAIQTSVDNVTAGINTLQDATIGPDGAVTRLRQSLGAYDTSGTGGFILNDSIVKLGNGQALAQTFSGITSRINNVETGVTQAQAGVISVQNTLATLDFASAEDITALVARVGDAEASISVLQSVGAGGDGTAYARVGLVLNVNNYLSGFIATNDGTTGAFNFIADRFAIVDPGAGGPITPFEVSGGFLRAPKIIAGDIFADTITVNHLKVGSVDYTKIQPQSVTNTVAVFSDATIAVSSSSNVSLLSGSVTPQGDGVVLITFYATTKFPSSRTTTYLGLYRNGTRIAGTSASFDGQDTVPMTIVFGDVTPPVGTPCTYEVVKESGNVGFFERSLVLTSAKR